MQAALQAEHDLPIGKALAQAKFNQDAIDNSHAVSAAPEPQKFFVKRGAVYIFAEKVKLKPTELVFVKLNEGEWRTVGCVDNAGQLPPQEITISHSNSFINQPTPRGPHTTSRTAAVTFVGSLNVKPNEVSDLLNCWRDSAPVAGVKQSQSTAVAALTAALKRGPKLSKEGMLRDC